LEFNAESTAQLLALEHHWGNQFKRIEIPSVAAAYEVQRHFVELIRNGDQTAGYKIGLTSQRMQMMCGIDRPVAGVIFQRRVVRSKAHLSRKNYTHLGLEFEICARLGRDLEPRSSPYFRAEVSYAVDGVCAAVELVDDRHADYSKLEALTLIADNSWNEGIVVGNFVEPQNDLDRAVGIVLQDGEEIGRGTGADVLGHPFEPLAWLATHLSNQGMGLKRGDFVMTGSLVRTRFPEAAFSFHFDVDGLSSVEVSGS
jgi:2-oxo-3-hexenedioate decarboxylase/2-keto-4-pentenoate hydratase